MKQSKSSKRKQDKRIVYYTDELNDDFAGTDIKTCDIGDDFKFINKNPLWRAAAAVVYYLIAFPIVWLISYIGYGLRIKNRRAVRKVRGGYFLYANHTQMLTDAFAPSIISFPKRAHVVANPDAVSIKGIRQLVMMLGVIPLPASLKMMRPFRDAVEARYGQNRTVTIYPEAHIWPYYTGIRPFGAASFAYPVRLNAPCIAYVTTYRRRKIFKNARPLVTITLSDPFYPDPTLTEREAKQKLRDEIYDFMCAVAKSEDNYSYITYIRKEDSTLDLAG
ncbi:MAG: 1-acyl-sn-glycerol-3-phosphate acyltransferase [Clostridia bacterium]|nr:1-acyl-sn-glycerol-3-phosphate acyltransferase [Clostridia bacterium]